MAAQGEDVYCTLVMNDAYLPGAAVLAHSLRDAGTTKKLAVLITLETLSAEAITELRALFDIIIPVERTVNPNPANLFLMDRGDLLYTFTKIALWRQTQFRKIVYIDSDVVALRAPDELFDIQASFAAAPDIGWPDAFNSGVMVITPNMGDYWALQTLASAGDSFDGADQGLLNQYYEHKDWHRLSFTYNCTPNAEYQWEPAYRYHKSNIKMVHFIGKDKPWVKGRFAKGGSGVYSELLGRWWAVYDRHLKAPAPRYEPGKPYVPPSATVQKHVFGESTDIYHGYAPEERIAPPSATEIAPAIAPYSAPPQIPNIVVEEPFTEPVPEVEAIDQGIIEPVPTTEQRRFSAPQMEWDATRSAPPAESRPEAANFPTHTYEFSDSRQLFHAPTSYPEPPKDMWYEVPDKPKAEVKPKAIFPWEQEEHRPKPSRVFAEDSPPPPLPILDLPVHHAPIPDVGEPTPFAPQVNAWDNVASIERYVRAVMEVQGRGSKASKMPEQILSPSGRRESLILTDFPSVDDRPSLPVTPAPIRRPTFWGDERDEGGDLPAAEGVPDQAEWNPSQKLEELRRSSLIEVEHLKMPEAMQRKLSNRDMPEHAAPLPAEHNASKSDPSSVTSPKDSSYTTGLSGSSSPHGLQTVPEETGSSVESLKQLGAGDGAYDLSPGSTFYPGGQSAATINAEFASGATSTGRPMFSEPEFGREEVEADPFLRRSPGSFSAATAREDNTISPTER